MPFIQSKLPNTASHVIRPTEATGRAKAFIPSVPASPNADQTPLPTDDRAVAPTAPPTAVQLQIKAILTEQARMRADEQQDASETPF